MSRILLLLPLLLWITWRNSPTPAFVDDVGLGSIVFLSLFVLLVLTMGLWSRLLARRVAGSNLHRNIRRFNRVMSASRFVVPAWFGVGLFAMGWGQTVEQLLGPIARWPIELPAMLIATLPALLAWMGLWWSQFPADRALREQSLMLQIDDGLPVHAPPTFRNYFTSNLRLQLLFVLVPVLLIFLVRDLVMLFLSSTGMRIGNNVSAIEGAITLCSVGLMFIFAPELLKRVLHTQSLPQGSLRTRLEELCQRSGLRYRDILLWQTNNTMANAAVMGIVPRWRYILMSDLLLETMTDQQIEAVFAHEVGHIVHRHMAWYIVFFLIFMFSAAGPGDLVRSYVSVRDFPIWLPPDLFMLTIGLGGFLLVFGYLSRRFEQQADVYAARTMQQHASLAPRPMPLAPSSPGPSHVGEHGATVFASALHRVAAMNNIPIAARSWCHGSIQKRIRNLQHLSRDPALTSRFDRFMGRIYVTMLVALCASLTWAATIAF